MNVKLWHQALECHSYREHQRGMWDEGDFGAIAAWWCDECGPIWEEPELVCTYQGRGFESYWGPEPAEYEYECPECGRFDIFENCNPAIGFKRLESRRATA